MYKEIYMYNNDSYSITNNAEIHELLKRLLFNDIIPYLMTF